MPEPQTIIIPINPSGGRSCGYCGGPGQRSVEHHNYHAAECVALLSCAAYQEMIDRGWRRSGTYCYKPDLKRSCCPQYTIRLDALAFKPSKSQRKLVNKWNRFVVHGDQATEDISMGGTPSCDDKQKGKGKQKSKGSDNHIFSLTEGIHAAETASLGGQRAVQSFEVTLEKASYTEEKYDLYCSYQEDTHKDHDNTPKAFKRFLCENNLIMQPIEYPSGRPAHLPSHYGAYHQLYRLDGRLVAMGVIDILPNCVSSVYFMWRQEFEKFSLGKLSAMREIALAREIHEAGVPGMQYLYMGFYIHSCVKMRYKGEYAPSYLADYEDYTWHPLERCRPLLEKYRYVCFSTPEHSMVERAPTADPPPTVPDEIVEQVRVRDGFSLHSLKHSLNGRVAYRQSGSPFVALSEHLVGSYRRE